MFFEFDDFDVRDRFYMVEEKTQRLTLLLESLDPEKQQLFRDMCSRAFIYHDAALDGVVISSDEILSVFGTDSNTYYGRSRLWQEIKNHHDILRQIQAKSQRDKNENVMYECDIIAQNDVIDMHRLLYQHAAKKNPGKLRTLMPLHSAYFHPLAEPEEVGEKLAKLCRETEHPEFRAQHPVNQAILFHHEFMRILPFLEGSGRVGRLFLNGFLLKGGYGIAVIHASDRQRYYETLRDGLEPLRDLVLDSLESGLEAQIKYVSDISNMRPSQRMGTRSIGVSP